MLSTRVTEPNLTKLAEIICEEFVGFLHLQNPSVLFCHPQAALSLSLLQSLCFILPTNCAAEAVLSTMSLIYNSLLALTIHMAVILEEELQSLLFVETLQLTVRHNKRR